MCVPAYIRSTIYDVRRIYELSIKKYTMYAKWVLCTSYKTYVRIYLKKYMQRFIRYMHYHLVSFIRGILLDYLSLILTEFKIMISND